MRTALEVVKDAVERELREFYILFYIIKLSFSKVLFNRNCR